jgi:hypothetical protein
LNENKNQGKTTSRDFTVLTSKQDLTVLQKMIGAVDGFSTWQQVLSGSSTEIPSTIRN